MHSRDGSYDHSLKKTITMDLFPFHRCRSRSLPPTLLLCLFLLNFINAQKTFDVCQKVINPTVDDYHDGVIFSVATGNVDALDISRFPKCTVELDFDVSHGERTELSFYAAPKQGVSNEDTIKCLNWEARQTGGVKSSATTACDSMAPSRKIVRTWTQLDTLSLDVYEAILKSNPLLDFKIFVQNVDLDPQKIFIYTTNRIFFECTHPNPYLTPNVRKDGADVDAARLNGRVFDQTFGPDIPFGDAGKYDCSWEQPGVSPVEPTQSVEAVIYSPEILCEVFKSDGMGNFAPVANASDNHVDVVIFKGDLLNEYQMRCSLQFAGNEEQSKVVRLQWEDPVWDPPESRNGQPMLTGSNDVDGNFKRRSFTHEVQLNSSISYTCRIFPEYVGNFNGGVAPKECKIRFATRQ